MPRDARDLSLIDGEYRMGQSAVVTGDAGDQPGAVPVLDGAPTLADLPVDEENGEPTALVYLDQTDNVVKIAAPDGSGGVSTGTVLDLSANVTLDAGDVTGLL